MPQTLVLAETDHTLITQHGSSAVAGNVVMSWTGASGAFANNPQSGASNELPPK